MPDVHKVKITAQDIETVSEKLNAFVKQLPAGEQNVMAWLLGRAAEAPPASEAFLGPSEAARAAVPAATHLSPAVQNLNHALGIAQFAKLRPGAAAAGSSIGVTGTVMF